MVFLYGPFLLYAFVCYCFHSKQVFTQAVGGILVAMVMKYADNIVKGFAVSVAIVMTSILSVILFGASIDMVFSVGAALVIVSIFNYNDQPKTPVVTSNNR